MPFIRLPTCGTNTPLLIIRRIAFHRRETVTLPKNFPEQTRRSRPKRGHCRRRKMPTPKEILAGATGSPTMSDDGRILAVPIRSGVAVLDLSAEETSCAVTEVDLPAPVVRVVIAPDNVIFALCTATNGGFTVHRLRGTEAQCVLPINLPVRDIVATRKTLVLSTAAKGLEPASLAVFTRDSGKIRSRETVARPPRLRRAGREEVLVMQPGSGALRRLNVARTPTGCDQTFDDLPRVPRDRDSERPQSDSHQFKQGCCCGGHDNDPNADGGRDPVPRRPEIPPDICVPGDDGDVDGCFVYVRVGSSIIVRNICEPGQDPCGQDLGFTVSTVRKAGRTVAALSDDGRQLMLLAVQTLKPLSALTLPRGTTPLFGRNSDKVLLLHADGDLEEVDTTPLLPGLDLGLQGNSGGRVYLGQESPVVWQRGGTQVDPVRVLLIPVMEPGQGEFIGTITEYFDHEDFEEALELVRSYWAEASYSDDREANNLDVEFKIFGRDTPTAYSGPPVVLDRPFRDFWNRGYIPGGIIAEAALPLGNELRFDGDERVILETFTAISSLNRTFDVAFPAAALRVRIPARDTGHAYTFSGGGAPVRNFALSGTDRTGAAFNTNATNASLSGTQTVTIPNKEAIPGVLDQIADILEEMLTSTTNQPFARPTVVWHDDGDEWGNLSITFFFNGSGGAPQVDTVDFANLFQSGETDSRVEIAPVFDMGTEGGITDFTDYLSIALAQSMASDGGIYVASTGQFDLGKFQAPKVSVAGGQITVDIRLAQDYAYSVDLESPTDTDQSRIEVVSPIGLAKIGMDSAVPFVGAETKLSGSGKPTLQAPNSLFDVTYTRMIDAILRDGGGNAETRIKRANELFNCDGLGPIECYLSMINVYMIMPVYKRFGLVAGPVLDPDIDDNGPDKRGLRAHSPIVTMDDRPADFSDKDPTRELVAMQIPNSRGKLVTRLRFGDPFNPDRYISDAATLTHEIGHALMAWSDQYAQSQDREDLDYAGSYDLMAASSADLPHFSSYHKLRAGWLGVGSIIEFTRPPSGDPINEDIVLVNLEGWDPLEREALAEMARDLLNVGSETRVGPAVLLRLGENSTQFDLLELRAPGNDFSQALTPPRLVMLNAIDPRDSTRYGVGVDDPDTPEDEGATGESVLTRYRRQLHLIDDSVQVAEITGGSGPGTTYDVGTHDALAEVGLQYTLVHLVQIGLAARTIWMARVRIEWERGPAIDVGFEQQVPEWQSPDIAVLLPGEFTPGEIGDFPDQQDPQGIEYFRVPGASDGPLEHQILVRVHNFGDAEARNVEVHLRARIPYGNGDWTSDPFGNDKPFAPQLIDSIGPGDAVVIAFPLFVENVDDAHMCLRAEIGDRDPVSGASNDGNSNNDWTQQNVFREEAVSNSPPAPVERLVSIINDGPYAEDVFLAPRNVLPGARLTIRPTRLRIPGKSRGVFSVHAELEERLLDAKCGGDIPVILDAWRERDHYWDRWGATKIVYQPRRATKIDLSLLLVPGHGLRVTGSVSPDIGGDDLDFHIVFPNSEPIWVRRPLGPASTFNHVIEGEIGANESAFATAYFGGNDDFASSVSKTVSVTLVIPG